MEKTGPTLPLQKLALQFSLGSDSGCDMENAKDLGALLRWGSFEEQLLLIPLLGCFLVYRGFGCDAAYCKSWRRF